VTWFWVLYHTARRSVAPEHQTSWIAAQTAIAALALAAASWYVILTSRLWREAATQRESHLMLQLMTEYDGLREQIDLIRFWYNESAEAGVDPVKRFGDEVHDEGRDERVVLVDDCRFRLSRFFVRIRKLVQAGYLTEDIVVNALDRAVIEAVFLGMVDPLDAARARTRYKATDREYFSRLLARYPVD
jgi:hypothetical protein